MNEEQRKRLLAVAEWAAFAWLLIWCWVIFYYDGTRGGYDPFDFYIRPMHEAIIGWLVYPAFVVGRFVATGHWVLIPDALFNFLWGPKKS